MDATPNRYAYRCLPLTIVNQTGWWVKNPVGFTATWRGRTEPGTIDFQFDAAGEVWRRLDQQPVRRGDHHLEHPVPLPHQAGGLAAPGLRPGERLQGQRPPAHGADRERLDEHVVHDELEADDARRAGPVRGRRAALPGDPARRQRLRRPGGGRRSRTRSWATTRRSAARTSEWNAAPAGSSTSRRPGARSSPTTGRRTTSRAAT